MVELQNPELSSDTLQEIRTALVAREPDLSGLQALVEQEFSVSATGARRLIYDVVLQLNLSLFPPVTHIELVHTEGCNLACSYCFEKNILGYRKMPVEVARLALDLFFDYSGDEPSLEITHFGGEPTLNFEGIRFATEYAEQKAHSLGKSVEFDATSNGVLLNEEMVTYFAEHRIRVLLSIDGLEAAHNKFRVDRGGLGTFKRAIRGLQILKQKQPWIGIKMTVMPENVDSLFGDVLGLRSLGVNQFVIAHATGVPWSSETIAAYSEQLSAIYKWYQENRSNDLKIAEFDSVDDETFFGCQAGKNSIAVTVNGEISPCSKIMGFNSRQLLHKLGDVERGLTHLRNRSELNSCALLKSACEEQGIAREFRGGCFAVNYGETGNLFQPSRTEHAFSIVNRTVCAGCAGSKH